MGLESFSLFTDSLVEEVFLQAIRILLLFESPSKAKEKLNWLPKISFESLVKEMITEEEKLIQSLR